MSKTRKGRKLTAEHRAKISSAGKGRKHSAESIAKMSEVKTGVPKTQEHKNKLAAAQRGKTLSAETQAKVGAATKTWWKTRKIQWTAEQLALMGQVPDHVVAALTGVKRRAVVDARKSRGIPSWKKPT